MRMRLIWFALPYPAAAQPSPGCHCPVYSMSSVCDGHVLVSTEDKGTESQKKKDNTRMQTCLCFHFQRHRARSDSLPPPGDPARVKSEIK